MDDIFIVALFFVAFLYVVQQAKEECDEEMRQPICDGQTESKDLATLLNRIFPCI